MSGLFSLFDDVAALAKLAAANLDDVAAAAGRASAKAAGVIVDDTAVTPQYLEGISPKRELPIIKKIALGSLRNKVLIILPLALLLSQFAPFLLPPLMILGGSYLAFEGMEKVFEKCLEHGASKPTSRKPTNKNSELPELYTQNSPREETVVRNAVRTDLILSAEIMVIALNEVANQGIIARTVILIVVAFVITFLVYGVVALLVKMDDFGLLLAGRSTKVTQKIGQGIIHLMPKILGLISVIGVFAMVWVGGHIVAASCADLGFELPHHLISHASAWAENLAGTNSGNVGIFLASLGETLSSLLAGALWGSLLVGVVLVGKKIFRYIKK